jgi:hypothetical protein
MDKNALKTLLAEGKTKQVIDGLKSLLPRLDDDLEKEVLLQSGRFEYYLSQKRQGTTSAEEQERALAKVNSALLEIIHNIPNNILPEAQAPEASALPPPAGGPHFGQMGPAANVSSQSYAWVSLIAFLVGAVLMALFAIFGRDLVGTDLAGQLYYIILIPCALASAAFLFGFMRSYATFTGHVLNKKLELGGPVVGALLVVLGGFYLVPGKGDFDITVRLVGSHAEKALKSADEAGNKAKISMDRGAGGTVETELSSSGYAIFPKVTAGQATFKITGISELALVEPEKKYTIDREKTIELKVKMPDSYGRVRGRVTDFATKQGLQGVAVALETSRKTFTERTDEHGYFTFDIPEEYRVTECTLRVEKSGYKTDEEVWYLGKGDVIPISLRPN